MERLVIVPDEKFEPLTVTLKARLTAIAREVTAENLASLMGEESIRVLLDGVRAAGDREALLWGSSERAFLAVWSSRPSSNGSPGVLTADREEGLVSQIFASGRTASQKSDELQAPTWTNLESSRGQTLGAMAGAAVPLFGRPAAVLTLAEYSPAPDGLDHEDAARVTRVASLFGRLLEDRLIRATLGLETL